MPLYELFGLDEHAARTAARVVYAAPLRLQHFDHDANDGARCIELTASLAFRARELAEEIFIGAAEDVARLVSRHQGRRAVRPAL